MKVRFCVVKRTKESAEVFTRAASLKMLTHIIKSEVDVSVVVCLDDREQSHDVLVATQLLEIHDLPKCSLRVGGVPEGVEAFLQRHRIACPLIHRLPDNTVGLQRMAERTYKHAVRYAGEPAGEGGDNSPLCSPPSQAFGRSRTCAARASRSPRSSEAPATHCFAQPPSWRTL